MVVGGEENEFNFFVFAVDFERPRFKHLCLIAAFAAWHTVECALLF